MEVDLMSRILNDKWWSCDKKVKISPLKAMKSHRDVVTRVYIYTATALGRGRVASPTLSRFYPRGKPRYSFLWGWVNPRTGVKKSPSPPSPGSNPGTPARSQAPCQLSYLAQRSRDTLGLILPKCPDICLTVEEKHWKTPQIAIDPIGTWTSALMIMN